LKNDASRVKVRVSKVRVSKVRVSKVSEKGENESGKCKNVNGERETGTGLDWMREMRGGRSRWLDVGYVGSVR
jgi:hypothetical protein